jgi:hypothetical protein
MVGVQMYGTGTTLAPLNLVHLHENTKYLAKICGSVKVILDAFRKIAKSDY